MREWILSSCLLILVVLILRAVLGKRISARLRYGLWGVVLVRLLVPVSFYALSTAVPQLPLWEPPETMLKESIYVLPIESTPVEKSDAAMWAGGTATDANSFGYSRLEDDGEKVVRYADKVSQLELLGWIWFAGAVVFGAVLIAANLRFTIRLRRVRRPLDGTSAPIPVYTASGLPSPCLMGVLQPAVYVTAEAVEDPVMLRHVLAHELTHYNHLDHIWSVLRGAALAVHWWNPLVWLAVVFSRRDGELACDEGALERLGDGERTAYGQTLLALVTAKSKPGDLLSFATTMSGGKRSLRERIQRIACQPKRLVSAMVVVIAVLVLSSVVAFGQVKENADDGIPVDPAADDARLGDAWKTASITVDTDGTPHISYTLSDGSEERWNGVPIPAPRAWADDDLAGRNEAVTLAGAPDIWAKMVSSEDGWLVACYERGVAAADTYVYRTTDRGVTWTEVTMPGTSWHIADVGFLSPERLIVAQRLFDDAPCFITKDGGQSWEEIELADTQVLSILFDGDTVVMDVGKYENNPATFTMLSHDMGDRWMTSSPAGLRKNLSTDLDHDGISDTLDLWQITDEGMELWNLRFTASYLSSPTWMGEAGSPHVGWCAFFLCRLDGEDYLLWYSPYMGGGSCDYRYKLFYLTPEGQEVVVQENEVEFDLIFDPQYADQHQYDPWAINAFMEEINALLADSELLVNTDQNLLGTFEKEGRLYDSVWWLNDDRDEDLSLLENLMNYGSYAQDHPDDVWSPLADLLMDLTEDDILRFAGDTSALVRMLHAGERQSRFYTWATAEDAYFGHAGDEVDYNIWNIPLADGSTLWLMACVERASVLEILETSNEAVSAFYDAPKLRAFLIDSELPKDNLAPSQQEVLAARERALAGMTAEQINRLKLVIRQANLWWEHQYMYNNIFGTLADPNDLYWNCFDQTGEIQIGWAVDGDLDKEAICEQEGLSADEFYSKYGTRVVTNNKYTADDFAAILDELIATVQNEDLITDLQYIQDEAQLAKYNHSMNHANNEYKALHDMDYFLLRYGPSDVGPYVTDNSTISKYYGMLSIYD